MWGNKVEEFMESAGHALTTYQNTDLAVLYLLRAYAPYHPETH